MKKLFIETYGCQMNVADSEVVASVMRMAGYETCETSDQADAVFLRQRLEVGAAEIWVYNIKIDKRDFLAGGAQAHRQIHR